MGMKPLCRKNGERGEGWSRDGISGLLSCVVLWNMTGMFLTHDQLRRIGLAKCTNTLCIMQRNSMERTRNCFLLS
ncbi:hypothetical protein RRG08_047175 [Elysia crispata]|uniref:Uncharacterized protein n=1 Tax=Elysia crispata TaxID=231223 RepID=A0AAE0YNG7_9GAST|nr:hypothetical protein RRG08_047175 [Elysia crispata]